MFRTPTIEHGRGSRRTLQMNSGSAAGRLIRGIEDEQSDINETGMGNNGDGEMLTILRNLQQQVSAMQAQQSTSNQAPASVNSESPIVQKKKKLPKALVVSVEALIVVCCIVIHGTVSCPSDCETH